MLSPIYDISYKINKLCKTGEYNLVLHKHLGDVFYAIGLKDEFERVYGKKLHFIVRPQHEFLMKMYGITNYSVVDLKAFEQFVLQSDFKYMPPARHKSHKFDMLCKDLFPSIPLENIPFILDGDVSSFFLFDHYWCFLWANNAGINENFKFPIPKNKLPLQPKLRKKLNKIAPLNKIILFAPEAATATELAPEFWNIIADKVHEKGYKIIVNSKKYKINYGICAFDLGMSLEDVVALGLNCAYVFSLRSGLCDALVGAGERLYAFYPAMLRREMNSLTFPFAQETKVHEILLEKWSISPIVWENIDLTPELQKYINSMKKNYHLEKIKYKLARNKNKAGHRFWYILFKDIFNKSKIFPDNNIDNPIPSRKCKQISLLGLPLYKKEITEKNNLANTTRYFLGCIIRFRRNSNHFWKLSFCGINLLNYNRKYLKFLGLPIIKLNWHKAWLNKLQHKINPDYDDIYILRHNIGETTVELMFLQERIKANKSNKPLLIVWDKKNIGFYDLFIKHNIDTKYIKLQQADIMAVFSQQNDNYNEVIIKQNNQRFICSTPQIAENMILHNGKNFYDYIKQCSHIPSNARPVLPSVSQNTKSHIPQIMQNLGQNKKFVILAPEANSLEKIPQEFWQDIIVQLKKKGYDIFVNSFLCECTIKNAKTQPISLEELFYLAQKSEGIITLGSGLAVLLALAQVPMDIIYTEFADKNIGYTATQAIEKYSVLHLPMVKKEKITEYNVDILTLDEIKKEILQKL